ncbi:hypothetical protein JCM8547_000271 [Rhodosporidiobolus lusitaniae]
MVSSLPLYAALLAASASAAPLHKARGVHFVPTYPVIQEHAGYKYDKCVYYESLKNGGRDIMIGHGGSATACLDLCAQSVFETCVVTNHGDCAGTNSDVIVTGQPEYDGSDDWQSNTDIVPDDFCVEGECSGTTLESCGGPSGIMYSLVKKTTSTSTSSSTSSTTADASTSTDTSDESSSTSTITSATTTSTSTSSSSTTTSTATSSSTTTTTTSASTATSTSAAVPSLAATLSSYSYTGCYKYRMIEVDPNPIPFYSETAENCMSGCRDSHASSCVWAPSDKKCYLSFTMMLASSNQMFLVDDAQCCGGTTALMIYGPASSARTPSTCPAPTSESSSTTTTTTTASPTSTSTTSSSTSSSQTFTTTEAPSSSTTSDASASTSTGTSTSSAAAQPTSASKKLLSNPNWNYKGCYTDDNSNRSLKHLLGGGPWTIERCLNQAKDASYLYAGIIYGGECWVGNEISDATEQQDASACQWSCNDNNQEQCGGQHGLDIYSTTSSKKNLNNPEWQYTGCYSDSRRYRTFEALVQRSTGWTVETCLEAVREKGYSIAGVIYGGECWGGNSLASTASVEDASMCQWACNDAQGSQCGGETSLDVYTAIPYLS